MGGLLLVGMGHLGLHLRTPRLHRGIHPCAPEPPLDDNHALNSPPWHVNQGQNAALDDLRRRVLFLHPDLKEKSQFWKRRASIVKVPRCSHRGFVGSLVVVGCPRVLICYPTLAPQPCCNPTHTHQLIFISPPLNSTQAHLLVLAHLSREPIPAALTKDANFILQKCPALLKELVGIACVPRVQVR